MSPNQTKNIARESRGLQPRLRHPSTSSGCSPKQPDRSLRAGCRFQRTVAESVTVRGTGLHSGDSVAVAIHPADEDTGVVFTAGGERVAGLVENVVSTSRGTTIGRNGTRFATVEHLMAALHGLGIDNSYVEVQGSEMPALDGSSIPFVDAISSIGLEDLSKERTVLTLREPVWVTQNGSFILAVPSNQLKVTYVLRYEHPLIGAQTSSFVFSESGFRRDIAPARTFVVYEEIAGLVSQRLAQGGSLANAIVVWQDRLSSDLRFPDELARHKVLDLIGDLALLGVGFSAEIVAVKSGHALNVEFTRKIAAQLTAGETREAA
ncbi:MAG: UDP-3-O-[3-hydroxymyristoyl] N-acetylglucosamine deacetylase [Armatimonadetes bacterium]|nr:UDP-3-O-[3-hydroxymyristoyl] N-acetylglucosamine deacetylase [Armatimonadota bacterium]